MPWREVTALEERRRFIKAYQEGKCTFKQLCFEFGISRKSGYKLINAFNLVGFEAIKEQSCKPKKSPNKTNEDIEKLIINVRKLYPAWAGEKIKHYLERQGYNTLPTEKTIDRILKRHGLITTEESEKHKPWKRFEHENPNDLWQMDFKGHFATSMERCHPLTVLDDHSRYSLLIKACADQQAETVKTALINLFRTHGLPVRMTMDNGSPWGYSGEQLYTTFSAWLIRLGIYVSHSRPNHPQTQGKLERFHRTLKLELLNYYSFNNLDEAQQGFDWWQKIYNEERPHGALDHKVPIERYKKSSRVYPETLPSIEYDDNFVVRKVQRDGKINFKGKEYRVGFSFYGNNVGLKETEEDGLVDVYFCHQRVVKIDLRYPSK